MNRQTLKCLATAVYGLAVIASGLYRFLAEEGGEKGLWFGVVMGTLALGAAGLLWARWLLIGRALAWLVAIFVGGWFVFESSIKKGFGHGDLRMYLIIALSLLEAVVLCLPAKSQDRQP
jgi:cation transport ATPase